MSADKQTRSKNRKSRSDFQRLRSRFMSGLLRSLFFINKPTRLGQAGFVLPTTVLLLLVLTLTMGALSFRAFSRSGSVIALREQQVIDSAASPAIDRAKSKLEYLFTRDSRFPGGVPSSDVIASMMLNDNSNGIPKITVNDPYTFPKETRIDINGNSVDDNAWTFPSDVNGNGIVESGELVVYSILMDDENSGVKLDANQDSGKANALVTRNGPINTSETLAGCGSARAPEAGWQAVNAATLQKNFQITAFVANGSEVNRTVSAIELQQVRQADRGNKWGAWFKYDLELFPGASKDFFWNGAMHTEGSLLVQDKYKARMISSHNSCLYNEPASEVTLANTSSFQGQLLSARLDKNQFGGTSTNNDSPAFHLFTANGQAPDTSSNNSRLGTDNDSVNAVDADLRNILLDPIKLFTEDVSAHRSNSSSGGWTRSAAWNNKRVFNNPSATPYLDDTYRADNRYGPKAVYDKSHAIPTGTSVGAPITSDVALTSIDPSNNLYGLDGYWERRAIGQGLRLIVGQRLELGNTFGWQGNSEPLYPPNVANLTTETRQRRSLYDNLAAVQGMVVYHYKSDNGSLPLACIASTTHPGTAETIKNSRTFTNYPGTSILKTDFLTGNGTNGWEFNFHSSFDTKVSAGEPLGIALRNLAYFSGDPLGGAPSFVPTQDAAVHPYPHQAMWGDFSNLRRVLKSLDLPTGAATYATLSPADKSTLHSAACTLGMLAYNVSSQQAVDKTALQTYIPNQGAANTLGADLINAIGARNSGPAGSAASACTTVTNPSYDYDCTSLRIDKESVIASAGLSANMQSAARAVSNLEQVKRDRTYGFVSPSSTTLVDYIGKSGSKKYLFRFPAECNPDDPNGIIADLFNGVGNGLTDSKAALALMCAPAAPKYPSLYYLFPRVNHSQLGSGAHTQPPTEEYVNQPYLTDAATGANRSVTYKVVGDNGSTPGVEDSGDLGVAAISLTPRLLANWKFSPTSASGTTLNPESMQISAFGALKEVSLLDKGMYDGRELMSLRMLDLDIKKLANASNGGDRWISNVDGIVYAFREDAIREDAIVRPKASGTSWTDCDAWDKVYTNVSTNSQVVGNNRDCRLARIASTPFLQDPPLVDGTNISTKPIDFYADPDRRPYGFRLINGATLDRASGVQSGMTFVSDNMVYIKGDFNLHTSSGAAGAGATACSNLIEEFTARLINDDCTLSTIDFYSDRAKTQRNGDLALAETDKWRPVEIVGDAVGVLSSDFKDGNIEDGFTKSRVQDSNAGYGTSSYQNQNRLKDNNAATTGWKRVDGSTTPLIFPIAVDRNGDVTRNGSVVAPNSFIRLTDGNNSPDFFNDKRGGDLQPATPTIVNAVFISGIVPSQAGQPYGGMHNFPRFLEHWKDVNLHISGGFFQLNFSTSATGPYDQDAWEPGSDPRVNFDRIRFYGAPNRLWGYDVGLQYAPAGPIARRFVTIGRPRSEFYRELPATDPYVRNLRCSTYIPPIGGARTRVYPREACT